ncbi:hypothetical protein AB1N83_006736 [Pleurotus pulmonarius]
MTSSECEHSSSRSIAHEFAKQMDANFGHASTTTDIAYRGRWQQHTGIGEALECGMGTPSPRSTALSRRLVPYVVHHVSTNSWVVTIRKPCNRDAEGRASSNQFRCFRWACPERGTSVHTLASFSSCYLYNTLTPATYLYLKIHGRTWTTRNGQKCRAARSLTHVVMLPDKKCVVTSTPPPPFRRTFWSLASTSASVTSGLGECVDTGSFPIDSRGYVESTIQKRLLGVWCK